MSAGIGRRDVLTGLAGLAVGAGAGGVTGALVSPATSTPPTLPTPGEALMTEHGVLKRLLLCYRAVVERIDAGRAVPAGAVTDAAQIIGDYVEGFHEGLEEAYVFPRAGAEQAGLVRTLLTQHDRGRHLTARIQTLAATGLRTAATRTQVRTDLAAFVRMYEPHEAWEDTVLFPAVRARTSPRTVTLLAERFHDLENAQYGDDAVARMVQRVAGIEAQLGIADLAAFTP